MVSFSGIDCSGKSTQIELLCDRFRKAGKKPKVVWSRFGYTPGVELVKKIIRGGKSGSRGERETHTESVSADSKTRRILFTASLMDMWRFYTFSLRLKSIGAPVICDRYIWDSYIDIKMKYPDYRFENGFWWRLTLKTMLKPEPSFCFFIPAEESVRRSALKDEPFPESLEERKKRIAKYEKELENHRWECVIDAAKPIDEVFAEVIKSAGL